MNLLHVGGYFTDPQVATWRKAVGVAAVLYVILPVDLIPDVIPFIGWLDDLGVITAALAFVSRDIGRSLARAQHNVEVIEVAPMKVR